MAAQIEALRALVERQRLFIGSMRASRFWRARDGVFAVLRRFGMRADPLPVPTASDVALTDAALGDPYQLFALRHRRIASDAAWLRGLVPLLAVSEPITCIVDLRDAAEAEADATLGSITAQWYPHWQARVWVDPADVGQQAWLARASASDARIAAQPWVEDDLPADGALGMIAAGDLLEPEAFLLLAIALREGADVVYTDEDRLRADGVCDQPQFKPGWSPETLLTRDYTGQLCVLRSAALAAAGGLATGAATAGWYDALLRVTERSERVVHVPRVMIHRRDPARPMTAADREAVLVAALARRGEAATVTANADGALVAFAAPREERVAIVIPTRDRGALLETCIASVFGRTTHPALEVIVVDNGSVEAATHAVFARWAAREPHRFRVLHDDGPFNFSRLNNRAVRSTDAPYVTLLNNDTEVIAPDWLSAMLGHARRPAIGAVGALLLYDDATVQHAGVMLGGVLGLAGHAYRGFAPDAPDAPAALRYDTNYLAVTGACLMVARAKFEQVGGLDEFFAVAFNDVDLCLKLHRAGYRNVVVPRARLYHYESTSRGSDDTRAKRERAFGESEELRRRWTDYAVTDPYYNVNLTLTAEDFTVRR